MSGLSTKNIKLSSGNNESKTIEPGNHVLKINKIFLDQPSFLEEQKGYFIKMEVETKPIEGFEGFLIDKDDESKGRYEGKIGTIKHSQWSEYDHDINGISINRDERIMRFIGIIGQMCGSKWLEEADGKYKNIEALVEGFNKDKVFKNKWFRMCIGGREYENQKGYTAYDMFLVKPDKGKHAYGTETDPKVQLFDESKHIVKSKSSSKETKTDDVNLDPFAGGKGSEDYSFDFES